MLPFLSDTTFIRAARQLTPAVRHAVIGIPYDGAVTNRPGSRFGPGAIRTASHTLCDATHPVFNLSPTASVADLGDIALPVTSLQAMRSTLEARLKEILSEPRAGVPLHPIFLGGDHSVTLSTMRAVRSSVAGGQPLACVHFDAHCDTWPDHFGEPSGHGTWVREAFDEGLVNPECFVQVGIRSSADEDARTFVERRGGRVFTARELRGVDKVADLNATVVGPVVERLRKAGFPPTYLTFDIDAVDPAFAPGTGTPEPGGLSSGQALTLVELLAGHPQIRWAAMDCVEVAPVYDHAQITALAAAHLVWTYLCGVLHAQNGKRP